MTTPITLTYKDKKYKLEYSPYSITRMNKKGFDLSALDNNAQAVTQLPVLFWGAFVKNEPFIDMNETDEMLVHAKDKDKLAAKLFEMLIDVVEAMSDDPDGDDGKNATWEVG